MPENQAADAERDAFLESQGIKVLRFWSSRLRKDKEAIRDTIWRSLQERAPRPVANYCRPGLVGGTADRKS
jgi:very-short-patch-repair endonuclease